MNTEIIRAIISIGALLLGGVLGFAFGTFQHKALLRDQKKQENKDFKKRRMVVPSSFRRIFYLVAILWAIQIVCPILFKDNISQWIVSAGIIVGYGWTLMKRLRMQGKNFTQSVLV